MIFLNTRWRGLCLVCLMLLMSEALHSDTIRPPSPSISIELTEAEHAWIAAHPEIKVGSSLDVPPMVFEDEQGQYSGLLVDYLDLLQQRLGFRFRLHLTSIPELFKHARERKIDIIGIMFLVDELKSDLNFTQVLFQSPHYIFAKSDHQQNHWHQGLSVLQDKRVGYLNGLKPIEILRAAQPQIQFVPFETNPQIVKALMAEQIDAIISNMTFEYWRQQQVHTGFRIVAQLTEIENDISMAVRNDWPELLTILNKALTTISQEERQTILNRWIGSYAPVYASTQSTKIELTAKEQTWLVKHPEIVYCFSPYWPPYDYSEAGQHQGLFADYLELFSRRLNIKLVSIPSKSWPDVLEKVRTRQCDFISGAVQLPKRESYLRFTKPYFNVTQVLLAKPDKPFVSGVAVLSEQSIGVLPNTAAEAFLRHDFPNMPLVSKPIEQLMHLLDNDEIYAFVLPLEYASHMIGTKFYSYKVIAKLEYDTPISVAVRHDWPELLSIMNKAVESLNQADHNQIRHQWPTHTLRQQVDYRLLWQVAGMAVLILLLMSYWNRKLARTQRELMIAKKAAEHANHAKTTFLANMSHELRTPLNAILGFSDIMLRRSPSPEQRDYLHYIQQSGNSLLDLIKDTLDLSKVETGKLKLDYQPCDVRLLLQDLTYPMYIEFEEKGLDLIKKT